MTIAPFQETNQSLIMMAVDALASAPHFTQIQKDTRAKAVANAVMAFRPAEPVQAMLAIQGVGHHFTLLDTFKEIANRPMPDSLPQRLLAITTSQTKTTLALIRELRIVRKESIATAIDAQTALTDPAPPAEPSPVPPAADEATIVAGAAEIEETDTAPDKPPAENAAPPLLNRAQRRALRHLAAAIAPNALSRDHGAGRRPASARR